MDCNQAKCSSAIPFPVMFTKCGVAVDLDAGAMPTITILYGTATATAARRSTGTYMITVNAPNAAPGEKIGLQICGTIGKKQFCTTKDVEHCPVTVLSREQLDCVADTVITRSVAKALAGPCSHGSNRDSLAGTIGLATGDQHVFRLGDCIYQTIPGPAGSAPLGAVRLAVNAQGQFANCENRTRVDCCSHPKPLPTGFCGNCSARCN